MANIIYLTLKGKKQGLISAGCGSLNSIGNNYQHGHENEIFIYSLNDEGTTRIPSSGYGNKTCR